MWPRKYGWLNFAILECSLNVWIVNNIVFAAPELWESALPNPKFLLHCRKWRNINLCWRKFQTSIFSTLRIFLVKTYKRDQWNLPNILAYISGIFEGFFKAGLVPLSNDASYMALIDKQRVLINLAHNVDRRQGWRIRGFEGARAPPEQAGAPSHCQKHPFKTKEKDHKAPFKNDI